MENMTTQTIQANVITPDELLAHWQGHRALTRRTIEAFPEKELFEFSIGGMRTFAELIMELLGIAGPGIKEIVHGETTALNEKFDHQNKKENLLKAWDETTTILNEYFPKIEEEDFHTKIKAFGQYDGTVQSTVFYFIDNEIHHRAQGYVYLRSLGIQPPFFWER
ncbi:damage-inducible protein DinB [Marinilongibacter aquaticus]|uniref:DinB family protein n=1 Tax=Marinilongibacter aquaticus TaxID=2975157 RepID=UPI0021BD2F1B|nr:DinB family protein [Marinilongibacter aquaticus]UBM59895.1 damage-inducible protein DinB [Marinilongibacter aquaticus]